MSKFNAPKPAGQPRTLRTKAQDVGDDGNFPEDLPYNYQQGGPESLVGSAQYDDAAKAALPQAVPQSSGADPNPLGKRGAG